jgi:geranylgeranyl reductase family protein
MEDFDAVIVGGGPVGCRTAEIIASAGFRTCVLEEHDEIGKPVHCAGVVSTRVIDISKFQSSIKNVVHGANVHTPGGRVLTIRSSDPKAFIIDRAIFDRDMAKNAVKTGAELQIATKAAGFSRDNGKIVVNCQQKSESSEIRTKILVGADGMKGKVAKSFNLPGPRAFLLGFGGETTDVKMEADMVEIFSGSGVAPGFFSWVIPAGDGNARIGLCIRKTNDEIKNAHYYFKNLLKLDGVTRLGIREDKLVQLSSGAIPIGIPKKAVCDNVMLVGDAAAQAKPTSGGGIYTGLRCALHCGFTAVEALKEGDFSEKSLRRYDRAWRGELGSELKKGWLIHSAYSKLDDGKLENVYDIINKPGVIRIIEREGDLDFASSLSRPLLKEAPALIKFAGPLLKSLF